MKRLSSSDSLGALMTVCPASEEHMSPRNNSHVYGRDFRSMLDGLDEEGSVEESVQVSEKKRRLSVDQVKALEKNFEVENKLEPERKVKLAQELGLQPRQVAVWFQNRRARWKTKQLERDYGHLKANYDALRLNFDALQRDKQALLKEIKELKSKLQEENTESNLSVKEEVIIAAPEEPDQQLVLTCSDHRNNNDDDDDVNTKNMFEVTNIMFIDHFKDGSSDSDSSAVLNDDNTTSNANTNTHNGNSNSSNPNNVVQPHQLSATTNDMSSSPSSYQPQQFVKIEEHNFFSGEETCNFFSDDQAPTLPWYCSGDDQWN